MSETHRDIICQVLCPARSEHIILGFLNHFIPERNELSCDYALDSEGKIFETEKAMVKYFVERPKLSQTFYWSELVQSQRNIMGGANFTSDGYLILSLTLDGTNNQAEEYLDEMKSFTGADLGLISYTTPASYSTGADFREIHQELRS